MWRSDGLQLRMLGRSSRTQLAEGRTESGLIKIDSALYFCLLIRCRVKVQQLFWTLLDLDVVDLFPRVPGCLNLTLQEA